MYKESVHYVKALERIGVVFVNVEDLDDSLALQLVDYDAPEPGAVLMARMVTPQFICTIRDEGGERVVYRKPIHDLSTLYNFFVNTARHLWRIYANCHAPKRGRKPKQKREEGEGAAEGVAPEATPMAEEKSKKSKRRRKKSGEV
jgi:hypothetical protein